MSKTCLEQSKNSLENLPNFEEDKEDLFMSPLIRLGKKGEGVYGVVYSACEMDDKKVKLAVKRNLIDKTGDFICSLRELDILARLNGHPHVVPVNSVSFGDPFEGSPDHRNILSPIEENKYKDDKIHFVFEEAHEDGGSYFNKANWSELKRCMVHLLLALEYCHGKGIIHRDVKPANLLIFKDQTGPILKLCDFGLSKPVTYQGIQTPSVVTSWYRAPEIVLEEEYDIKADLWSVGCIFFEMVTKLPLLNGSRDQQDEILDLLRRYFPFIKEKKKKDTRVILRRSKLSWKEEVKRAAHNDEMRKQGWEMNDYLALLDRLLCPVENRYTATEALEDKFFSDYREYIEKIRENYPPFHDQEIAIRIVKCKHRSSVCQLVKRIFRERKNYSWYSHRALFQAMSLFDRYLSSGINDINLDGKLRLAFTTCLYIAVKYFTTMSSLIPFSMLYGEISQENKKWAENFEFVIIVQVCQYLIYQPTLYETADIFNEELLDAHIEDLLNIYLKGEVTHRHTKEVIPIDKLYPSQVYSAYRGWSD